MDDAFDAADRHQFDALPGGGYAYDCLDDGVRIEVRYLRRDRGLHAEVDVQCLWAGARRHRNSLSCADLNLSSQSARRSLAKYCAERSRSKPDEFDWAGVLDAACIEVIQADRQGDEAIVLDDATDVEERDVNVRGLQVPIDAASMLIAHGGGLKSLLLLLVAGTLVDRGFRVLYVDWEWTGDRHKRRKRRMFGPRRLDGLFYLRSRAPVAIEADRLRRFCDAHQIDFLCGDSVGLACDGKLTDDDVAIRFHRVLTTLPPSMWAAHVPKASLSSDTTLDPVGPFGSVFFSNLCRATWLVKKQSDATDEIVHVGLFPQKQNDGDRQKPIGLEFTFAAEQIEVRSVDLADVEGLSAKLPLTSRITHLLKPGPRTYAQLAEELGAKVDSVIKAVNRREMFRKVLGVDGVTRIALVERTHV